MSGACRRRARLAAVLGNPMPTRTVAPSGSARAAAMVIISSGRQRGSDTGAHRLQAAQVGGVVGGAEDVPVEPRREGVAVAADPVPAPVEVVVAVAVPGGGGGMGAARDGADGGQCPVG